MRLARSLRAPRGARLRSLTPDPDSWQASPAKKARVEQNEQATPPSSPLSAEQLVRIQRNKAAALLRLAARNVPPGLGESWKQQLCGEFGKPYFVKVGGRGSSLLVPSSLSGWKVASWGRFTGGRACGGHGTTWGGHPTITWVGLAGWAPARIVAFCKPPGVPACNPWGGEPSTRVNGMTFY